MASPKRFLTAVASPLLILCLVSGSAAQVEDQLSNYSGDNATGYLQPLADGVGADLNSGLFHSAYIPKTDMYLRFEVRMMSARFGNDDKTFEATTEGDFLPQKTAETSTVVGPGDATIVDGQAGTSFIFPGGFDIGALTLATPQLRIGSYMGTEALIRYIAVDIGDVELGNISLFGFGLRHSISQYLDPAFPVALSGGFFWQSFKIGENAAGGDLMKSSALSIGAQASKRFAYGILFIEPYTGLSLDRSSMEVAYESDASGDAEAINLDFGTDSSVRFTVGLALNLPAVNGHVEYSLAGMSSFSFGVSIGN
ncbi:MAG: DUF6588 family protein [Candidatus Eisenbacteria bacterium]